MATITGTQGEKVDQVTQLLLAVQAQIRVLQWLLGIFIPVLILFASWLALTITSTKLEIVALQGKVELVNQRVDQSEKTLTQRIDLTEKALNQRMDQMDKRMDQMEKRMDQMEKTLAKIDAKLDKIDERLGKIEDRLNKVEDRLGKLEKPKP